jgi:hypothetical protein
LFAIFSFFVLSCNNILLLFSRSRGRSAGDQLLMHTNLSNNGGLSLGSGTNTEIMSTGSLSVANVPEILQSLLKRVNALEEELSVYRSRKSGSSSPLRPTDRNTPGTGQKSIMSAAEQEEF